MKYIFLLALAFLPFSISAQDSPFYKDSTQINWVNNTYDSLSLDERIGQLFMVAAYSNKNSQHENFIENLVKQEGIGGLIFMQDNAEKQVTLTNRYQTAAKIPLLIGMDAEWDLSMRLKNTNKFPWSMTMGAIQDNDLVYKMGNALANHAKRLGVHMNFAPVVDVNTNPNNPIIGNRSFGSDVTNVAQKGTAYARGMQDIGVLASAKHFPGHGDTSSDSHKTLPTVKHGIERLTTVELYPFQQLIDANVASIMVAHLNVPTLEPNPKYPSSLSKKVVTDLLKTKMKFKGLIITDALNMKAVANAFPPGVVDAKAFEAGNDILLFSQAVKKGKEQIKKAITNGSITMERLEESVKKILMAKYFVGLENFTPISAENIYADLNLPQAKAINQKLYDNAVTALKNTAETLPIENLDKEKIAFVALEEGSSDGFYNYLRKYSSVKKVQVRSVADVAKLKGFSKVIIGVHKSNASPYKSYKVSSASRSIIQAIAQNNSTVLTVFGSPYALKNIPTEKLNAVVLAYQNNEETHKAMPQILFGALGAKGRLPADVNDKWKAGAGTDTKSNQVLGYDLPENQGLNGATLELIDELAEDAITKKATPGMQVLVARNGKIVYEKAFGHFTYDEKKKLQPKQFMTLHR